MWIQKLTVAVQPAGIVTDCDSVSVWLVPYPSSQAAYVPPCAGSPLELCWPMTPLVAVHEAAPDSKPGLASFWPEQVPEVGPELGLALGLADGVGEVPLQVGSPLCAGTLT